MESKLSEIVESISNLSVLELVELKDTLEEKWGVTAAVASVAVASASGAGGDSAQEKTAFNVVLKEIGDKKIHVIKEVKAIKNLDLKGSKDFVESAPVNLATDVSKDEAEELKKKLEAVGATIVIE